MNKTENDEGIMLDRGSTFICHNGKVFGLHSALTNPAYYYLDTVKEKDMKRIKSELGSVKINFQGTEEKYKNSNGSGFIIDLTGSPSCLLDYDAGTKIKEIKYVECIEYNQIISKIFSEQVYNKNGVNYDYLIVHKAWIPEDMSKEQYEQTVGDFSKFDINKIYKERKSLSMSTSPFIVSSIDQVNPDFIEKIKKEGKKNGRLERSMYAMIKFFNTETDLNEYARVILTKKMIRISDKKTVCQLPVEIEGKLLLTDENIDTDGDGLTDTIEYAIYSNMNDKDTDNDGYNDYEEVMSGYNPNQGKAE